MKVLFILALLILVSCGSKSGNKESTPSSNYGDSEYERTVPYDFSIMAPLDGREPMLVIGDSISMGYTPALVLLFPDMQVIHNVDNAQFSRKGRALIDGWVAHAPRWSVCTINHGLHDIRPRNSTTVEEYVDNLRYELEVLKDNCDKVLFINSTNLPVNIDAVKYRVYDLPVFNQAAEDLMNELNVPVCDLYTLTVGMSSYYVDAELQMNPHFTSEGSYKLAQKIKTCLENF